MSTPTGVKPPPLPGWLRVDYHYSLDGEPCGMNTLWLSYDPTEAEAADDTDLATIEAKVRNDWLTYWGPHVSASLELVQLRLVLFRASGEIAVPFTTSAGGSQTGALSGQQAAVVVNWDVHAFYRGGKPKIFIPGVNIDQFGLNARTFAPTYTSSLESAMNAQLGNVHTWTSAALTVPPVPIAPSFVHAGAYRTTALQRQIYRAWVQLRICTQRRRLGAPIG